MQVPVRKRVDWRLLGIGLAALAVAGVSEARAAPIDREAFLKAVAEVETGGNTKAVGRYGERGLYQFHRSTWRRYTNRSFYDAHDPEIAHDVAVQHFVWLYNRLSARGVQPTAYQMAVAWNGGLSRAISGRAPKATRDYARRVSALSELNSIWTRRAVALSRQAPAGRGADGAGTGTAVVQGPVRLDFSITDADVAAADAPEVVALDDSAADVTFSLTPEPADGARIRFFFATIGE